MDSENQVLITGIVKNAEATLAKDIERLNSAFARFSKVSWFLVESNSDDRTKEILLQMKVSNLDFNFVSLDQNKSSWIQAIAADKLEWAQVSDLKYWSNAVAQLYQVEGIPQNFLIDPNGIIIAKNLRGSELLSKLNDLLK